MPLYNQKHECFGCGVCAAVCPNNAIVMHADQEGFLYPEIDTGVCVECKECEKVCPSKNPLPCSEGEYFAVRCNDAELLRKSSSGGAFSLIANEVIEAGGLVCGACFDDKFSVKHILSRDIANMRKSKYVHSDMLECLPQIKGVLEEGRTVLFSGTPCQCHALKLFLGGNTENLLLVAVICRGVQSPELWTDYVAWLGSGRLEAYDFRDKRRRNDGHTVAYTIGGKETAVPMDKDAFSRLYSRCLTYRPSCYDCPYCTPEAGFDFSIGDFWGIEKIYPQLHDGLGTSLIIARNDRAVNIIKGLEDKAIVLSASKEEAIQPALLAPAKQTLLRKLLFRDFARKNQEGRSDIELILKKYASAGSAEGNTVI